MALPSNISSWLRKNGSYEQRKSASKICRWCEDLGHRIVGGTAIGKYYDTLILDLTYQGGEISVYDDGTISVNHADVFSKQDVKKQLDEIFNKKQASILDSKKIAKQLVKIAKELVAIRKPKYYHSMFGGNVVRMFNDGKLSNEKEIIDWVKKYNGGAAVESLTKEVKDILQYYKQTGITPWRS